MAWMVGKFGSKTGKTICCHHCGKRMLVSPPSGQRRWEIDRFPLCGHLGGTYRRGNIVPSCRRCNETRCAVRGKRCRGRAVPKSAYAYRRAA